MRRDFITVSKKFFKIQMQQTKRILSFHLHVLKSFSTRFHRDDVSGAGKSELMSFKSPKTEFSDSKDMYSTLKWSSESTESIK